MIIDTTLKHWGNSAGIRITKEMMATAQFSDAEPIEITVESGEMIIKKQKRKNLSEMFADYHGGYPLTDEDNAWVNAPAVGDEIR